MNTRVLETEVVRIPSWVTDLSSFRNWVRSGEFPESGRIFHLHGEVWVDMSLEKDTVVLRDLYWQAGIAEYWLVDARGERLDFHILHRTAKGYVSSRRQAGWLKSAVFGKSFRLTRQIDGLGHPDYHLAVR
jgi:hypothetical protein